MIELSGVSAGYGSRTVLQEVSAIFEKGSLTTVIGVNGCGKSTLLKTILGLVPVQRGAVMLDGSCPADMKRTEIAKKAAYLAQGKHIPDMTVAQMVLHGRFPHLHYPRRYTRRDHEITAAAMERVGIAHLAHCPLHTLSGGMRQTAYLAMVLAQDTDYVLLDEPTTYLDIAHQLALMELLRELAHEGRGVVAVLHDLPLAFTCSDRIVLLHQGRILGQDPPETLCRQPILRQVFGVGVEQTAPAGEYRYRFSAAD